MSSRRCARPIRALARPPGRPQRHRAGAQDRSRPGVRLGACPPPDRGRPLKNASNITCRNQTPGFGRNVSCVTFPASRFCRKSRHTSGGAAYRRCLGKCGGLLIRWFADLPIERKLRVVITVPAMAAFAIAMVMHVATSLLQVRSDMDWPAYVLITAAAIAAAVFTSYWLAARLQQQISGPIVNLAHTMQRVSLEEDYSLRVERSFGGRDRLAHRRLQSDARPDQASRFPTGAVPAIPRTAGLRAHGQSRQRQPGTASVPSPRPRAPKRPRNGRAVRRASSWPG